MDAEVRNLQVGDRSANLELTSHTTGINFVTKRIRLPFFFALRLGWKRGSAGVCFFSSSDRFDADGSSVGVLLFDGDDNRFEGEVPAPLNKTGRPNKESMAEEALK
jgi:hypothetical protein